MKSDIPPLLSTELEDVRNTRWNCEGRTCTKMEKEELIEALEEASS